MIKTYKSKELGPVTIPFKILAICPRCNRLFSIDEESLGEARCNFCETDNLLEKEEISCPGFI